MITGKLQRQQPQRQLPVPRTPEEVQALFESLVAAGQVPQEVLDRMQKGERFQLRVTPQGLALQPAGPDAGAVGGQPDALLSMPEGAAESAAVAPSASPGAAQPRAPASPPRAIPAAAGAQTQPRSQRFGRPAGTPKPGRNAPCPCGSGIKYKKCCAPAFD